MLSVLPGPSPAVIFERVADGAVLLHREEEIYFGLNAVAVRIWELLPPASTSLDELCGALALEYPAVEPEELRQDVVVLLKELMANGLVSAGGKAGEQRADLAVSAK